MNATFFPIGTNVEENPAAWRTIAAAGFPIGNHTYDHADLTCRDFASVVADIEKDNEVVGRIVGHALVPFLRPPGGAWDQTVLRAAEVASEHSVIMWDTTVGDSGRGPVSQLVANGERARAGSIVLMHANDSRSAEALPELIAHYRALGYGFATLGQLLGVPGPAPYPVFPASARPSPTPAATSTRLPTSPPASPSPSATEPRAAAASRFREAGLHRQRRFE